MRTHCSDFWAHWIPLMFSFYHLARYVQMKVWDSRLRFACRIMTLEVVSRLLIRSAQKWGPFLYFAGLN